MQLAVAAQRADGGGNLLICKIVTFYVGCLDAVLAGGAPDVCFALGWLPIAMFLNLMAQNSWNYPTSFPTFKCSKIFKRESRREISL